MRLNKTILYITLSFILLSLTVLTVYLYYPTNHPYVKLFVNTPVARKNVSFHESQSHPCDNKLCQTLLQNIHNSTQYIHFAFPGIRNSPIILNALKLAKLRGVVIEGVIDSDTNNYYSDSTQLISLLPNIHIRHSKGIMHNKFFVFDKSVVWHSTANVSSTSLSNYNAENSLIIHSTELAQAFINEILRLQLNYPPTKQNLFFFVNDSKITLFFSDYKNLMKKAVLPLLKHPKKSIHVAAFYLTHINLAKSLIKAHNNGVQVYVILDAVGAKNPYSKHHMLRNNGVHVKVENWGGKMHMKSILVDQRVLITGSMNFSYSGSRKNDENVVVVANNYKIAQKFYDSFDSMWNSLPDSLLSHNPNPESPQSYNSCHDNIDNDHDSFIDALDTQCNTNP